VTLRRDISTPDGKRRYVRRLFATIADRYDFITRFLSCGQDHRWKTRLVRLAAIQPADRVLDLACGTGDIVLAAAPRARRAVGLDLTYRMLQLARERAGSASRDPASVRWAGLEETRRVTLEESRRMTRDETRPVAFICGDMLTLPFGDGGFDVVTIGYGLRNVPDLRQAIAEIDRVLAPGGRLLSLDFNRPRNPLIRTVYLVYLTIVGSALGLALHGDPDTYRYIPESIRTYPGAAGVARLLEARGFTRVQALPVLGGFMTIHVAHKGHRS
jgi:demethylmenaquinone methyltransferase/2-methoxy-6-polyprenyl-1,4-benzoquinol methylase